MADSWKQFFDKTKVPLDHGPPPRLPYEHDEARESEENAPRESMLQAYRDLMNGLVDTDMHGLRGVEEVVQQSRMGQQAPAVAEKNGKP